MLCIYIAARRLDYCTQEVGFFQRAAKYGLHNSVKLSQFWALIGLEFVLRHPGGVEFTVTECFLRNTH